MTLNNPDIRGDDHEPINQHQVERDKLMEGSMAGWMVCDDAGCDVKLQPHSHRVRRSAVEIRIAVDEYFQRSISDIEKECE